MTSSGPNDPVLVRRARISDAAAHGRRIGYSLFLAAIMLFLFGYFTDFKGWIATSILVCLAIGSVLLIPSIVLGYAVKAADRHDLGLPDGH